VAGRNPKYVVARAISGMKINQNCANGSTRQLLASTSNAKKFLMMVFSMVSAKRRME
jgi:hypothetical protein